ncbi:methyltransferase domain-containing protein [Actinomadura viridis]|uniref:23S rRNA (Guanine745-N1)-methyltransferase n=1 Tax=Actinomadura viridis TaxID=58110 RepID=A0A931GJ85_9ACTN|nr:methyltransferase domain-containing protein [Actinomadura viridis]MBG6089015.1 23S rRNA (guanine745-N1)-methyltransferase [Actinomadura viridis]
MLADVVEHLTCPICGEGLALETRALRCPAGHAFDIARQGYANLLPGDARAGTADTAEMVRARESFLGAGHFDLLTRTLGERVAEGLARTGGGGGEAKAVLDAGAGTGHYLRAVLDRSPAAVGVALDISKHAARRAGRAHPRIGAIVADLWRPLPVRDATVDAIVNVFAPRNAPEFHRVLKAGGVLYTVTPSARHLGPLVGTLGLLTVDEQKSERMDAALAGHFVLESREGVETEVPLSRDDAATLVGMGPSAHHVTQEDLHKRLADLPAPIPVPLSFVISVFRGLP